jgi:thiol-disulfide isomerase/thioredoxin
MLFALNYLFFMNFCRAKFAIYLFIFISLYSTKLRSQNNPNTTIIGTIKNHRVGKFVQVEIDNRYLDNRFDMYETEVSETGKFGVKVHVYIPQLIKIKYVNDVYEFFIQPGDSLDLNFDMLRPMSSLTFQGIGSINNQFLQNFRTRFYEESNEFTMKYYRQGTYNYRLSESEDNEMQVLNPESYTNSCRRDLLKKKEFLNFYSLENQNKLTPEFISFMEAEIQFKFAYKMLAYGQIYQVFHKIDLRFFDFINAIPLKDDKLLGNKHFRSYIEALSNYFQEQTKVTDSPYTEQYLAADNLLENEKIKWWFRANIIKRGVNKGVLVEMVPFYDDFARSNPYKEFDQLVVDAFQSANRLAAGSNAPDFNLTDINGKMISLKDFKGKVVYIDFWATWCRPCISKMQQMKSFEEEFAKKNKDVVFVHVSLDGEADKWMSHVNQNNYPGMHLISAGGTNGGIALSYEVKAVPKFYIIDKNGKFATQPKTTELEVLKEALVNLSY